MSFCTNGEQKTIGSGVYYICSISTLPCKFARWCAAECKYKPNANFNSCAIRAQQRAKAVEAPQEVVVKKKRRKKSQS